MRKLILIVGAVMLFAVAAHAQKLTTTQPTVLCDPTTITNCAPVSATNGPSVTVASVTAAANANQAASSADTVMCATDIGCRPGSAISVTTTMQNGATANGNGTVLAVDGMGSAIVTVICSVSCATTQVIFEAQNDGSNFVSVNATQSGTTTPPTSTYTLSGTTAVAFQVPVAGFKQLRARILNYSSGTITAVGTTVPIDFNSRTINSNLYAAGTAVDTNSGNKSAATPRVVIATDQPQLTSKFLVTPDSVALPANQSVNESQINGITPLMGNGVTGTGSQRVTIASDNTAFSVNGTLQTQTDTVMVGGVNVKEINAVTPLMGNGVTGTGSQRVTISSDNTAFSVNPLSATAPIMSMNSASANSGLNSAMAATFDDAAPTSITENNFGFLRISANRNLYGTIRDAAGNERGANVTAGNALLTDASATTQPVSYATTGSGTATGALRVELANNGTGLISTVSTVTNLSQMNGAALLMGNGTTGTGSQRVTIASDNSPVAGFGVGATGAAIPANAMYAGAQDASGNTAGDIVCTSSKIYDASTSGNTELVAISGSKHVYVCGYEILAAGTVNVSLVTGTGTACASAASGTPSTGTSGASAGLTPAWQFTTQTGKLSAYPTHGYLLDTGSANALCLKTSGGIAVQAQVFYSQR